MLPKWFVCLIMGTINPLTFGEAPIVFVDKIPPITTKPTTKLRGGLEKECNCAGVVCFGEMSFGFDGISINFGAISRRFATRRFTQMKQISQTWLYLIFIEVPAGD